MRVVFITDKQLLLITCKLLAYLYKNLYKSKKHDIQFLFNTRKNRGSSSKHCLHVPCWLKCVKKHEQVIVGRQQVNNFEI